MVLKKTGSWRMCVDYKDLNKAYPKDHYPLPEIDLNVDCLAPLRFKCFPDAYRGYHQIQMAKEDDARRLSTQTQGYTAIPKCPSV